MSVGADDGAGAGADADDGVAVAAEVMVVRKMRYVRTSESVKRGYFNFIINIFCVC
jgi:hypothetical protein